ncbi:hypothetical protein QTO34_008938 [Cnephaeus nilssonii]|uniref:Leucine-rich repeat-containing protein 46 n=1 Tax=Cnephaeus nilssonii TaxID=3371016 RepID=A0AA40HGY0_CNENI|nr:hypothetical protein QTO34_008938 [Eptesicus nilssonii]
MPGAQLAQSPEKGEVCITEALITKRNLTFPEDEDLSEKMFHTIAELQTVRLDREGITAIKNLEGLRNLHSLYLQANKIQRIENLACVPSLRFLSLAGNRIQQVENLRDLPYLQFLDLSENLIATLELDEFPQSLLILNLTGNSCTNQDGYRQLVTGALPLLMDLDRQPVASSASGPEDSPARARSGLHPTPRHPVLALTGFLKELEQDMSRHRAHRQQAAQTEHLLRLETQPVLTELPRACPNKVSPGPERPPQARAPRQARRSCGAQAYAGSPSPQRPGRGPPVPGRVGPPASSPSQPAQEEGQRTDMLLGSWL